MAGHTDYHLHQTSLNKGAGSNDFYKATLRLVGDSERMRGKIEGCVIGPKYLTRSLSVIQCASFRLPLTVSQHLLRLTKRLTKSIKLDFITCRSFICQQNISVYYVCVIWKVQIYLNMISQWIR